MDRARGLVDLDWSQRTPIFHPDDIYWDPRFNQYPYPDDDLDYDDEEEMETDYQNAPLGGASDARVATLASAGRRCYRPPATYSMQTSQGQTSGSPRSTHTDTDMAMEMGGLSMAPRGPNTCHVHPRAKAPTAPGSMSTPELATTVACGVAAAATQILEWYAWPPNEAERPPVDQAADAALRECLQRCLKASPWTTPGSQPVSERVSVFYQLGHRVQDTQEEDKWALCPEMPGESSELEVLSEKLYTEYCKKMPSAGEGKSPLGRAGTLWLHLKKAQKGWTQASQSGTGPGVGNPNWYPKEVSSQSKQGKLNQPSRSPLTNELLDPGEELLGELDYEDVEEINPEPDPEIAQAIAHIPKADICGDVALQDVWPPPGFEPKVVKAGYDVNLVCSDQPKLGSSSPVTAGEDRILDVEESQPRAPGNSRLGYNPNHAADN